MSQKELKLKETAVSTNRRSFLKSTGAAGIGAAMAITGTQVFGESAPSQKIVLAIVGCGGRGSALAAGFLERGDCSIAWVCDPFLPRA